jgi:hypothetical protein
MAIWILLAVTIVGALGYSPLPIMVIGALLMVSLAYFISRHASLLRLGAAFSLFAAGSCFVGRTIASILASHATTFELKVLQIVASDELLMAMSGMVILISVMIGTLANGSGNSLSEFLRDPFNQKRPKN